LVINFFKYLVRTDSLTTTFFKFFKYINLNGEKNEAKKLGVTLNRPDKYNGKTAEQLEVLNKWLILNIENPMPDKAIKKILSKQTGLTVRQINQWFSYKLKKIDELNQF
jgi:hypothetical protein